MAKRKYLSIAEKRAIVAEKQQNKVSMKQLAEKYHVSDSMIYSWQKQFREQDARTITPDIKSLVESVKTPKLINMASSSERELALSQQLEAAMDENDTLKKIIMTLGRAL